MTDRYVYNSLRTFVIRVQNFSETLGWLVTTRISSIKATLTPKLDVRNGATLVVSQVQAIATGLKVSIDEIATVTINKIEPIGTYLRALEKWTYSVSINSVRLPNILYLAERLGVITPKINTVFAIPTVILGLFKPLSDFDPEYMSDLDANDLSFMDFTVV